MTRIRSAARRGVRRSNSRQLIASRQGSTSPAGSAAPAARSPAALRGAADLDNALLTALRPVAPAASAERHG